MLDKVVTFRPSVIAGFDEVSNMLLWIALPFKLLELGRLVSQWHPQIVDSFGVGLGVGERITRRTSILSSDGVGDDVL